MINDILNGIGDITGAIASAVESAIGDLGTALGKMLPDISGIIPDISLSAGNTGVLLVMSKMILKTMEGIDRNSSFWKRMGQIYYSREKVISRTSRIL